MTERTRSSTVHARLRLSALGVALAMCSCSAILGFDKFDDECFGANCIDTSGTSGASSGGSTSSGAVGGAGGGGGAEPCTPRTEASCYSGPPATEMVGPCKSGLKVCNADGSDYGPCTDEVVPQAETCLATEDENCNGLDCVEWAQSYGDPSNTQEIAAVAIDPVDGSIVVVGSFAGEMAIGNETLTTLTSNMHAFVARLTATGAPMWARTVGRGSALSVAIDSNHHVYVGGIASAQFAIDSFIISKSQFLLKLDETGTALWAKPMAGQPSTNLVSLAGPSSIVVASDGELVVAGMYAYPINFGDGLVAAPAAGAHSGYIAKVRSSDGHATKNSTGAFWSRQFENVYAPAPSIGLGSSGKIFVGATFATTTTLGYSTLTSAGGTDIALAIYDNMGGALGGSAYGDSLDQRLDALATTPFGSLIIAGSAMGTMTFSPVDSLTSVSAEGDGFIVELSSFLQWDWGRTFGTAGGARGLGMDEDGNARLLGYFTGSLDLGQGPLEAGTSKMLVLASFTPDGTTTWNRAFAYGLDQVFGMGLAVDAKGASVIGGGVYATSFDLGTGSLIGASDAGQAFVASFAP